MLNVSSETPRTRRRRADPGARAGLRGLDVMRRNRGVERLRDLSRGLGRLAAALEDRPVARRARPVPEGPL